MARARNIKPGFYKNEDLAECSVWARLLFPGLWMLADREGRLEDRPKRIKGELLPFDSQDVEPLLRELASRGFILRYEVDGARLIQILKFKAHQTPHYTEKQSVIKPPPLQEIARHIEPENSGSSAVIKTGALPPDSLNPDSPNHESRLSEPTKPPPPTAEPAAPDPIFGVCLDFLKAKGVVDKDARSFLGMCRKNHGDEAVFEVVQVAKRDDVSEPISWITKALQGRKTGKVRHGQFGSQNYRAGVGADGSF